MTPPMGAARAAMLGSVTDAIPDSGVLRNNYDLRTLSGSDGDPISTVADQEGSDDLTGDATLRTSGINGQNTAEHDGSNDILDVSFGSGVSQPYEYFVVGRLRDNSNNYAITDGDSRPEGYLVTQNGSWQIYAGGTAPTGGSEDTNIHIFNVRFDDSNSDNALIIDGGTPTIGPQGGAGTASRGGHTIAALGDGARTAPLDWGHMLFFSDKLSTSKRNEFGNYLADEWGLSWTDV